MKVRRLELENFRRHRRTQWELPDGLTAVVGPNGAGKSSLVEALTFALYGRVATAKDLVRSAEAAPGDTVRVGVEFDLAGQAVRVVRELRGKAQNPVASVTVDGALVVQPVTGSADQATAWVQRQLGLDREAFLHTVVARQKEIDRLGRLKPAERRAFVLDLVGISALDAAVQRARDERNQRRVRLDEARRSLEPEGLAQERLQAATTALAASAQRVTAAQAALKAAVAAHEEAQRQAGGLEVRQAERAAKQAAVQAARDAHAAADTEARAAQQALAVAEAAAARRTILEPEAAALPALEAQLRAVHDAQQAALAWQRRQQGLDAERRHLAAARADLAAIPLPAAVDLAAPEAAYAAADAHAQTRQRALATAQERLRLVQEQGRRLHGLDGQASCPTCLQGIAAGHLEHVHEVATRDGQVAADAAATAQAEAAHADAQVRQARVALAAARTAHEQASAALRRRDQVAARVRAQEDAIARLQADLGVAPTAPALDGLDARVTKARLARDELLRLAVTADGVVPARQRATACAAACGVHQTRLDAAMQALAAAPEATADLAAARSRLADAVRGKAAVEADLRAAEIGGAHAARDAQAAEEAVARQQQARSRCAELEKDLALWTALVGTANDGLLDRFREHMVVRTAPLIQAEASRLLSLFTGGRYSDVVVESDYSVYVLDDGVRYELERFSGGEQDLVHLAIRLAISRLLATRANAPELRFLALDEVFGGLDDGRQRLLVDGLQGLSNLYGQVLCITHDDAVREGLDHVVRVELVDGASRLSPD